MPMSTGIRRVVRRRLDPSGPPAYAQIEGRLAQAISAGDLAAGERLPPERELARRLGVSRMTLRQALDDLERRGLLVRVVGRHGGTFVAEPKVERDLTVLAGLSRQLQGQGRLAGARLVRAEPGPASPREAGALGLPEGDPVFEIVRVRLSDGRPLALERSVLPAGPFPGLLELPLDGSLYELMEGKYGRRPARALERLEPVAAGPEEAELLEVKPGAPMMLVERTAFDDGGAPVEWALDVFRGDRTRVVVETRFEEQADRRPLPPARGGGQGRPPPT